MSYRLLYHPRVPKDLKHVNRNTQERIATALENRLAIDPESYGKPLAGSLSGFWKMRVGDYRIIFKISKEEIWVLGIIDRRDVYSEILKRPDWAP